MKRKKLWIEVDKILWEDWDPIGIKGRGPSDEYRGYVPSIVNLLMDDHDVNKITEMLHHHKRVNMGMSSKLEDHSETAEKLIELKNKRHN